MKKYAFYYIIIMEISEKGECIVKKRKTIAVIAADVFNNYMNRIFVGISE